MGEPGRFPRTLSCAGGEPRGRKSRRRRCGKAIEAQPSCGQIVPSMRPRQSRARRASGRSHGGLGPHKRRRSQGEGGNPAHGKALTAPAGWRPVPRCRHRRLSADGIGALDRSEAPAVLWSDRAIETASVACQTRIRERSWQPGTTQEVAFTRRRSGNLAHGKAVNGTCGPASGVVVKTPKSVGRATPARIAPGGGDAARLSRVRSCRRRSFRFSGAFPPRSTGTRPSRAASRRESLPLLYQNRGLPIPHTPGALMLVISASISTRFLVPPQLQCALECGAIHSRRNRHRYNPNPSPRPPRTVFRKICAPRSN
jgi:hypothetical protein